MMKKVIKLMLLATITASAWEINTHRAIDKLAIEKSANLKRFVDNAGMGNENYCNKICEIYRNLKRGKKDVY